MCHFKLPKQPDCLIFSGDRVLPEADGTHTSLAHLWVFSYGQAIMGRADPCQICFLSVGFVHWFIHLFIHSTYIWGFFFFLLGTVPGAGSIAAKGIESEFGCGDSLETEGLPEELDISRDPNQPANTKLKVQIWKNELHLCLEEECPTKKPKVRVPLVPWECDWLPWHEEVKTRSWKLDLGGPHRSEWELRFHFEIRWQLPKFWG